MYRWIVRTETFKYAASSRGVSRTGSPGDFVGGGFDTNMRSLDQHLPAVKQAAVTQGHLETQALDLTYDRPLIASAIWATVGVNMKKHGAELHLVRPDRVAYTSVLQAIPGYLPVQNAYDVSQRFVTAPYYATGPGSFAGPGLMGLGRLGKASLKDRWRMFVYRIKARAANRRAQKSVAQVAALPAPASVAPPVTGQGTEIALRNQAQAALMLTAGMAASGDNIMPPAVVEPEIKAGTQISYSSAEAPFRLASLPLQWIPNQRAVEPFVNRAYAQWVAMRTRGGY